MICNDRKNATLVCHFYICSGPATVLEEAIAKAFEMAKLLQVDPFALNRSHTDTPEAVACGFADVQMQRSKLSVQLVIGQGQFGQVFLAQYHTGEVDKRPQEVAVKLMRADASNVDAEEFLAEAHILMQFDHPKCIRVS